MLFGKSNKSGNTARNLEKLAFLCGKEVSYVVKKSRDADIIIGKNGYINLCDGRVVICCGGRVVFDRPTGELTVGELMSKNGATFTYTNEDGISKTTVVAYYSYYRK